MPGIPEHGLAIGTAVGSLVTLVVCLSATDTLASTRCAQPQPARQDLFERIAAASASVHRVAETHFRLPAEAVVAWGN